jgi:anti-sigma factor RsiW
MSKTQVYFRDEEGEHSVNPLLVAMAERVGIDLASTESPAPLAAMQRACAGCQNHERCDDWTHSPDGVYDRSFCPNADVLDQLSMRTAVLFDHDRLQLASFKTDIHPDRETRDFQSAMDLTMRDEPLPLHASPPLHVGSTDGAEDVLPMASPVAMLRGLSAVQRAGEPDAQNSEVKGGDNDAISDKEHDDHLLPIPFPVHRTVRRGSRPGWGWAIAASIAAVMMFGGGVMWGGRAPSERADLVDEVAGYHQVYSRETTHLVEVPASQAEQLTAWLSERLDHAIKVPDLADAGLHFAGGRMLVINDRPVAELMYTRAHGLPIAVCVTQIEGKPWSMDVEQRGALRVATWAKDAYAYAVVGEIGDEQARDLARRVKAQI